MAAIVRATGIPWYFRQDYPRILAIMDDADALPPRYDIWLKKAEAFERNIQRGGGIAVRAIVDPQQFPVWCAARGLNVGRHARNVFAREEALRIVGQTH